MGESIDVWREFFRTTDTDVFEFIDKAITIAALDCPKDLLSRRDRIAERLFPCQTNGAGGDCALESKESKASGNSGNVAHGAVNIKHSRGEAETFSEDVKETSRAVDEVLRIRQVLDNSRHESDSALHESLRRLRSMNITVDILERTKIGVSVNSLRRNCKQIAQLAHDITMGWKAMVEEIYRCTEDVPNGKTSSVKEPRQEKYDFNRAGSLANRNRGPIVNQHKGIAKPDLSSNTSSRTTPASVVASPKFEKERMPRSRNSNGSVLRCKRPLADQQDNTKGRNEAVADLKLRAAKRKMQGLHQKAETDKRRRTVQVLDPFDLPKMAASHEAPGTAIARGSQPRAIWQSHNRKSFA